MKRKGIGYMIEVMASLLVVFTFILGNAPSEPSTDWSSFQKEMIAQDITYTLEKTGDTESFIRGGETGSLKTAAQTIGNDRVSVTGTVENVPISSQTVGFNIRPVDRFNDTLEDVDTLNDQCHQDDDLQELESEYEILRSENQRAGAYIYITDSDPGISGGTNGEEDYDTLWVDNGTKCQFSSAEGPYYNEEFFYWGDGDGGYHWDFNEIHDAEKIEIFNSTQIIDLRPVLRRGVNGIDTGVELDAVAADREDLSTYDMLVFREVETLESGILDGQPAKIKEFMNEGSVLLMMNLEESNFYGADGEIKENFLTDTGLRWVELPYKTGYRENPGDRVGGSFSSSPQSEELETFFSGLDGQTDNLDLAPAGNISSSNDQGFKDSDPLLYTEKGSYNLDLWNATNYSMQKVQPSSIDGYPETACVEEGIEDGNLTRGNLSFTKYETSEKTEYRAISTKLGENDAFCRENNVRALNIDFDHDNSFDGENEGPFLEGENLTVEGKKYTVNFPSEKSLEDGVSAELVYIGRSRIENINFRTGFQDFSGEKLARIQYKENYSEDEKKMISAVIHWLSEDTQEFGESRESSISTTVIGGVKEKTYMPYRISLRWR